MARRITGFECRECRMFWSSYERMEIHRENFPGHLIVAVYGDDNLRTSALGAPAKVSTSGNAASEPNEQGR